MGVGISVGWLAEAIGSGDEKFAAHARRDFKAINAFLASKKLPVYEDPEKLPKSAGIRWHIRGFPYSDLHYLRRFYAVAERHASEPDKLPPHPAQHRQGNQGSGPLGPEPFVEFLQPPHLPLGL